MPISRSEILLRRLWWVGPLAVLAANAAVLIVRAIVGIVLHPSPDFIPLRWRAIVIFTTVLVTVGVLVFAIVGRFATRPIHTYRRIALVALVVSMIPDLRLPGSMPGASWPAALALMLLHVAAWWTAVTILTRGTVDPNARLASSASPSRD